MAKRRSTAAEIVTVLRQVEVAIATGKQRSPQQVCKRDQAARRFGAVSFTGIPSSNSCPS